jgi:hypothetical protein
MQRYSILFGVMGLLAGLALLFYINLAPQTPRVPPPLAPETLVYNIGRAHQLPGTEAMLYENSALGIRFGYPKSYGTVVVEKRDDGVFFSFSQSGATNDPKRVYFLAAEYLEPKGHEGYWGDLSWFVQPDPRWMNQPDVCALFKETATKMPSWTSSFVTAPCENIPLGPSTMMAKLNKSPTATFLIPAFQTANDDVILEMFVASDERLLGKEGFADPAVNIERLVKSIEFIPATK